MWLGVVNGRFQVIVDGYAITDAPYAAFQPREANGSIRFLDREGWEWELNEIGTPPPAAPPSTAPPAPAAPAAPDGSTAAAPDGSTGAAPDGSTAAAPGGTSPSSPSPSSPTDFGAPGIPGTDAGLTPDRPNVHSDEPYSAFDHLFYPSTRAPSIVVGGGFPHLGLILGGADRLELQRWSLAGYIQPVVQDVGDHNHYGAAAQ